MRFAYMTDLHIKGVNPEHRLDNYTEAITLKLEAFGWEINNIGIQFVLIGGDMFDIPKVSNKLLGNISRILKNWQIPIYIMPGNHDIYGHNLSTLEHTSLGILINTGVAQLLTRDKSPYVFNIPSEPNCPTVAITAMEYIDNGYKCSDIYDPRDYQVNRLNGDINILMAHAMIMPNVSPFFNCINISDIDTNADLVLCSHFHQNFTYINQNGTLFLNPGPTGRTDASAYNIDPSNTPGWCLIDITQTAGLQYAIMHYSAAVPGDQVFDVKAIQLNKAHQVTLNSLKQLKANIQPGSNIVSDLYTILDNVLTQHNIEQSVKPDIVKYIQNAEHNAANNSTMAQGYIPAHKPVYIRRIYMVNFQSHKDTEIIFDETGFNAIVGETDKGKSSIIRAIKWCLYNEPNGIEMIRTGEDSCQVLLEFSNGNIVIRERNRKSTGAYHISGPSVNADVFKGFGRNIPIEIINTHQIPKGPNIADQLEGPYMLSNTAPERAAMIGSIVGTDIVDAAIKEVSGEIIAAQKLNAAFEKKLLEITNELEPYDNLDSRLTNSALIGAKLDSVNTFDAEYKALYELYSDNQKALYEQGQAEYYLSFYNNLDMTDALINKTQTLIGEHTALDGLLIQYKASVNQITTNEAEFESYNILPKINTLISFIDKAAKEYTELLGLYNQYNNSSKTLSQLVQESQSYDGISNINIPDLEALYDKVVLINELRNRYKQADKSVVKAEQELASVQEPEAISTEYQNLLVQLGRCPTCGAAINASDTHYIEI